MPSNPPSTPNRVIFAATLLALGLASPAAHAQDELTSAAESAAPAGNLAEAQNYIDRVLFAQAADWAQANADLRRVQQELSALEAALASKRQELSRKTQLQWQKSVAGGTPWGILHCPSVTWRAEESCQQCHFANRTHPNVPDPTQEYFIGVGIDRADAGVEVTRVYPSTPAEAAGFQVADVISACNGIKIVSQPALIAIINAASDQELSFSVDRGGEKITLKATPARREDAFGQSDPAGTSTDPDDAAAAEVVAQQDKLAQVEVEEITRWIAQASGQGDTDPRPDTEKRLERIEKELADLKALLRQVVAAQAGGGEK